MEATPQYNRIKAVRIRLTRWARRLDGKGLPAAAFNPRKWFWGVIAATLGTLLAIGLLTYVVDPYQVYRKPTFYKAIYDEPYYSIPGIARHYQYDSILVGSSMCQNFLISNLHEELGGTWVKLTPAGCRPITCRTVMDLAFAEKPIRRVLLGLDIFSYSDHPDQHRMALPEYIYDKNPWNDYRYLLNKSVVRKAIPDAITTNLYKKSKQSYKLDADRMWNWDFEDGRGKYGYQTVMAEEKTHPGNYARKLDKAVQDAMAKSFNVDLLEIIRQHRDTEFTVFFPPYSVQAWYGVKSTGGEDNLRAYLDFKRMTLQALLVEPNVQLFDFQADRDIITNFDNYKDGTHYSPAVNRLILSRIRQGIERVTPENLENGIAGVLGIVNDFVKTSNEGKTP